MSMGPPGMGPPGIGPPGMGPPGIGPPGMGPPGMGPPGMGPPGMGPNWDDQRPSGWGKHGPDSSGPGWERSEEDNDDDDDEEGDQEMSASPAILPSLLTMKIDTPEEYLNKPPQQVTGLVLPKALEEALAYKDQRQAAFGSEDQEKG